MKSIQWNSMNDVPTDGTIILLHRPAAQLGVGHRIIAGAFNRELDVWQWPDDIYDEYDQEEFNAHIDRGDCFEVPMSQFVGWLPLPEAMVVETQ